MQDKIRTLSDLGRRVRAARKAAGVRTTDIAARSGRSRDVLHRLERGDDVSLSSLLSILSALGLALDLVPAGRPGLEEMSRRFGKLGDDDHEEGT